MKITFIHLLGVALSFIALSSCESYLDINANPNAAEVVAPKLLFSNVTVSYMNARSGGNLYIPMALAGQSITSGGTHPTGWGTPSEEQYQIGATSVGNTWRALYTSVGGNLTRLIALAENATPRQNNAAAQAKVLLAQAAFDATTIFGDVPFSEAWNTEISYPRFDPQKEVLEGVVQVLDEALDQFEEQTTLRISDYDLFYGGDIAKWKKAARSLKLRTLMTMVDQDPSKAAAIGQLVTAGGMISNPAENLLVHYGSDLAQANPKFRLYEQYAGGTNFFWGSTYVVDFMRDLNDPRLPFFFDKPAEANGYYGLQPGADADHKVHARIAEGLQSATAPEVFFSYQEQLFFEAEVYARGLGVNVDVSVADARFREAVAESAIFYGVPASDAHAFVATLPHLSSLAKPVETIHYHHWVDKMDRGIDAFTQWRRSGPEGQEVPALTPPKGAPAGGLFRRYPYPVGNEIAVNPRAPQVTVPITQKQWFDL